MMLHDVGSGLYFVLHYPSFKYEGHSLLKILCAINVTLVVAGKVHYSKVFFFWESFLIDKSNEDIPNTAIEFR